MFEFDHSDDRLTLRRAGTRWLSNGFDGGFSRADTAHNLTVQEGFDRTDLACYADERLGRSEAGRGPRDPRGPTLLTGVSQRHARGARCGPVEVVATAGLSNPAVLPMPAEDDIERRVDGAEPDGWRPGTVNVFVGTTRALDDGAMAGLLATTVEAKTATLLAAADVPGTTSDAVVVGSAPDGEPSAFAGSATEVGAAARACVRDAIVASLDSRYGCDGPPSPESAKYGLSTSESPDVFEP